MKHSPELWSLRTDPEVNRLPFAIAADGESLGTTSRRPDAEIVANQDRAIACVIACAADLRKQLDLLRDDLIECQKRLAAALNELRCPDCGCADQIDAESSECGCDAPVCNRDGAMTLARAYVAEVRRLDEIEGAANGLLRLMDAVPVDPSLGDETDRVFSRGEFAALRTAIGGVR